MKMNFAHQNFKMISTYTQLLSGFRINELYHINGHIRTLLNYFNLSEFVVRKMNKIGADIQKTRGVLILIRLHETS